MVSSPLAYSFTRPTHETDVFKAPQGLTSGSRANGSAGTCKNEYDAVVVWDECSDVVKSCVD